MKRNLWLLVILISFSIGCGKSMAKIYFKKGMEHHTHQKYQMAIAYFDKAVNNDPQMNEARFYRSMSYLYLGHQHTACEEMSVLVDLGYPDADSTLLKMGCVYFPTDTNSVSDSLEVVTDQ